MKQKKLLKKYISLWMMASMLAMPTVVGAAGNTVVSNNTLPSDTHTSITGNHDISKNGNSMDINQTGKNGIIKWDDFSIGANATVNFKGNTDHFNTLNYVTGSNMSQIYGKMNANNNGNIYLVNPNGVQIGNSAQINVGSLYVSTKKLDDSILNEMKNGDFDTLLRTKVTTLNNAELMSLGYVTANKVTFEGKRVIIDMDRLQTSDTDTPNIHVVSIRDDTEGDYATTKSDVRLYDVVLGSTDGTSTAWENKIDFRNVRETNLTTADAVKLGSSYVENSNETIAQYFTYQWIKDAKGMNDISKNLSGHYALRNAIDLTGEDQSPIGQSDNAAFTGKFDGLGFNIFGLSMDNSKGNATGLFGYTKNALVGHVNLIAGTDGVSITGGDYTGALIGHAVNTRVYSVTNTLKVKGNGQTGGLIGYAEEDGNDTVNKSEFKNLINTGNVNGTTNVGGLIGQMKGGSLGVGEDGTKEDEESHNVGKITGTEANVGGLVGMASDAKIGGYKSLKKGTDEVEKNKNAIYNAATVEGGYNVGGIVGQADNSQVINVRNETNILANGYVTEDYYYRTAYTASPNYDAKTGMAHVGVRMANAGGIVGQSTGSNIWEATNMGDVQSTTKTKDSISDEHYAAGNVGGIVGRAENSNIYNAINKENEIRGAMNVGGIAGYFGNTGTKQELNQGYRIKHAENNGGNILATGGIDSNGNFAQETTRSDYDGSNRDGNYFIGNMGGIVGLVTGDSVHIASSGNRGTVHTGADTNKKTSQAINVGGIAGKIDVAASGAATARLNEIKKGTDTAVISSSYNSGEVQGYANIGGIAGFAYNGSIAESYNLGHINTTRADAGGQVPINMGGILGDSTEHSTGRVVMYDTYNKGDLGDSKFSYYGRHVGGIVGRLSGIVEKSYNTGNMYNKSNVVGGIAGYWYSGYMKNVFNTGNITVINQNQAQSQVGGIVGGVDLSGGNDTTGSNTNMSITNAYNIGAIRSFKSNGSNTLGGIVGSVVKYNSASANRLEISNVYTGGNLYADSGNIGAIVGAYHNNASSSNVTITNAYYIRPSKDNGYIDLGGNAISGYSYNTDATKTISYDDKYKKDSYQGLTFTTRTDGSITDASEDNWRINEGNSLPILNAFLPGSHDYFSKAENWQNFKKAGGDSIQYGTAYDPLLTIIHTTKDLTFNWKDMNLKNNGALAVIGGGLTLNDVHVTNSTGIFGGTIYANGALTMTSKEGENDILFGAGSQIIGSSVQLKAAGTLTINGEVEATGNGKEENSGDVTIDAGDLEVYGQIKTAQQGKTTFIPGIGSANKEIGTSDKDNVAKKDKTVVDMGDRFSYQTPKSSLRNGNLTITTKKNVFDSDKDTSGSTKVTYATSGDAHLYYGNQKAGKTMVYGNLSITSDGNILSDTDLGVDGTITMNGSDSTSGNEIILDISHMGGGTSEGILNFLDKHSSEKNGIFGNNHDSNENIRIAMDGWDSTNKVFNFKQYGETFGDKIRNLYVQSNGTVYGHGQVGDKDIHHVFYTWINNAEQLAGIQKTAETSGVGEGSHILEHNFMLRDDIDASSLTDFKSIGTNGTYQGTFDGRNQRIIGLTAKNGLIQKNTGTVENLYMYSSVFTGDANTAIGAIAGTNTGTLKNIVGLGNTIKGINGNTIGGLAGENQGTIKNVEDQSTIIAGTSTVAGGLAGKNTNENKEMGIFNAQTNSAVTTDGSTTAQLLGGIVGENNGHISNVSAHGVTGKEGKTKTAGGIVGKNTGAMEEVYNNSVIHGSDGIGGIAGENTGSISNIANAVEIIGDAGSENVGGLVGNQQSGTISDGRNTGTISGGENVGGMVGTNGKDSMLKNLENGSVAQITGVRNVGGIAGNNVGTISAENQSTLMNKGEIYGWENVGGIAGKNSGTIENVNSDIYLHIIGKDEKDQLQGSMTGISATAQYFGGVTGENVGIITNATNSATVDAAEATYVGGIVGRNAEDKANNKVGQLLGMGNSNQGKVIGKNYVGGVIGKNEVKIKGEDGVDSEGHSKNVGVTNSGMVIATAGGAGGIIGENDADISFAQMTNQGEVHGNASVVGSKDENGTGGIIGVNKGTIQNSSMMNTLNGKVTGISNVGGLIGINHGTVTGGRDSNDGYYQHQIYNNGTIQAGSYDETTGTLNSEGRDSKNIGGLIGSNTGNLTAGYNTGVIFAGSSTNVGGVAGTNSGTIDQVFTNVMTENGQNQTITGASNVGGIVGNNANGATISNAYTAQGTTVNGTTNFGLIAGTNEGTISNVYGASADQLVGSGTKATNGYGMSNQENDYKGFDFTGNDNKSAVWKIYEDHTNPLLKVFLTKASVKEDALKKFVYNGQNQLDIKKLIDDKTLTNQKDADFADFTQSSFLLQSNAKKDAGTYTKWLWSAQIGTKTDGKGFDPNNLGYDFTVESVEIAKKALTAKDFAASIVYGNQDGKDWQIDKSGTLEGVVSGDDVSLAWNGKWSEGGNYVENKKGRLTADVGDYKGDMKVTGIGLTGDAAKNYSISTTADGDLTVTKAKLDITVGDATISVGQHPHYGYKGTNPKDQLVNGDVYDFLYGGKADDQLGTPGDYANTIGVKLNGRWYYTKPGELTDAVLKNYDISVTPGTLHVKGIDPFNPEYIHWNYLFHDTPWDKQWNERERKAEIHFVSGGMRY